MGGNALTNTKTRRYQADEFRRVEAFVVETLRNRFPDRRVRALDSYRSKADFGDLDVMFESSNLTVNLVDVVNELFSPNQVVKNGPVTSFNVEELQVDLVCQSSANFETAFNYYRYSDLGNLMGRVAHKLGFKLGHEGLVLVLRDGNYQFAELLVSKDWAQCLRFLGYSPYRFFQGFDTLEEVFEYATSTPFFNKAVYEYDNRNHTARVRDAKRAAYRGFLEYLEARNDLPAYQYESTSELGGRVVKEEFLARAYEFFPDLQFDYEMALAMEVDRKEAKRKFNGDLVSELTGLKDKDLGFFMKTLRQTGKFETCSLLNMTDEQVKELVQEEFAKFSS
jgi:hypothetical protein